MSLESVAGRWAVGGRLEQFASLPALHPLDWLQAGSLADSCRHRPWAPEHKSSFLKLNLRMALQRASYCCALELEPLDAWMQRCSVYIQARL